MFAGGARAVHITHKPIYRALGIENVKHRRGKHAATPVLMRRLLSLDYLIERPTLGWLPTEDDKVQRFEALGIDRGTLPSRNYGPPGTPQVPRYFDLKFPLAVDEPTTTFVYVDAGHATDSELRSWGAAHAPLWAALRARTFAVHVVAIGTGVLAAQRAAPVLKSWTRDGDGQGAPGRPRRRRTSRTAPRRKHRTSRRRAPDSGARRTDAPRSAAGRWWRPTSISVAPGGGVCPWPYTGV